MMGLRKQSLFVIGDTIGSRVVYEREIGEWKGIQESSVKQSKISLPSLCFLAVQHSRSELRQTQHDVRQQSRDEDERKDGRSVFVIIPPFRAPRPQPQPSVNEDDGGVRDGEQGRKSEHRGGDQTVRVAWFDEVEEGRGDRSDVDREVEPFL